MSDLGLCRYHQAVFRGLVQGLPHLDEDERQSRALVMRRQCRKCQGLPPLPHEHLCRDFPRECCPVSPELAAA